MRRIEESIDFSCVTDQFSMFRQSLTEWEKELKALEKLLNSHKIETRVEIQLVNMQKRRLEGQVIFDEPEDVMHIKAEIERLLGANMSSNGMIYMKV